MNNYCKTCIHNKVCCLPDLDPTITCDDFVSGWISVKDGKPNPEEDVFVRVMRRGHEIITTAMYEDGTMTTDESTWFWNDCAFDYNEILDGYIIPEGWWESRYFNDDGVWNNAIDGVVTHWMPIFESPKEE